MNEYKLFKIIINIFQRLLSFFKTRLNLQTIVYE